MTLCIAAICQKGPLPPNRGPCAIISYDRKLEESGAGSHQIGDKMEMVAKRWWALFASDDMDKARDMLQFFRARLTNEEDTITRNTALGVLYDCLHDYQTELLNRYIHAECGLSLTEFLSPLGNSLAPDQQQRIRDAIDHAVPDRPRHEAIFVGWIPNGKRGAFHIFRVVGDEIVQKHDFAAVGSGCFIAHTMWNIRQKTPFRYLPDTLYRVYEAQRMGANEPSVGLNAYAQVMTMEDDGLITIRALQSSADDKDSYPTQLWEKFLGLHDLTNDIQENQYVFHTFHDRL